MQGKTESDLAPWMAVKASGEETDARVPAFQNAFSLFLGAGHPWLGVIGCSA